MSKRALCVGINNYPGTSQDLSGCVNDATDWQAVLEKRGFSVTVLLDGQASKGAMVSALNALVETTGSGDLAVFQYSGHGSWIPDEDGDEPDGRDEVLCPHDIGQNRPLSDDELNDIFAQRHRGSRIVFISDSCHSGSVSRLFPSGTPEEHPSQIKFMAPEVFLSESEVRRFPGRALRAASPPGRNSSLLMSGCQDVEYSYDAWFGNRPNGAFTYAALSVLKNLPPEATYRSWYREVRKLLPSTQHPQSPNLYGTSRQKNWRIFE